MSYRLILCIALGLQSFSAIASNDLDKWNSPEGRVVRSTLKNKTTPTTTYKEKANVSGAQYSSTSNGGKVLHRIEHATTESGSKKGVTIEALKKVDKAAVAKKWAKEIGKGGVRFTVGAILIEAAMQEMLDGLDWVMGEGGQVTKKSESNTALENVTGKYTSNYRYSWRNQLNNQRIYAYNVSDACSLLASNSNSSQNIHTYSIVSVLESQYTCKIKLVEKANGKVSNADVILERSANPYKNLPEPPQIQVSPQEIETKIKDYLDNSPNASKDLLIEEAYKPTGKGYIQWSDDPDSRVEIFGDTPDIAKRVYESDNPVADGLTKTTPKIIDSTSLEGDSTPKENPESPTIKDPVTGQPIPNPNYNPNADSGSKFDFKLPPFCEYAAKVCEWLDWTQEDPPEEEKPEEPQVPSDQGIFSRTFDFDFNFGGSCPPDYSFYWESKYFGGQKTFDLSWLCMIFTFLGYPLIFLCHCLGFWIFYEVASRKEIKW